VGISCGQGPPFTAKGSAGTLTNLQGFRWKPFQGEEVTTYIWHINNFLTHLYCCYEKIGIIFIVFAIIIASSIIITLRVGNDINGG